MGRKLQNVVGKIKENVINEAVTQIHGHTMSIITWQYSNRFIDSMKSLLKAKIFFSPEIDKVILKFTWNTRGTEQTNDL